MYVIYKNLLFLLRSICFVRGYITRQGFSFFPWASAELTVEKPSGQFGSHQNGIPSEIPRNVFLWGGGGGGRIEKFTLNNLLSKKFPG